jgi:thiamine monophosphate synthase
VRALAEPISYLAIGHIYPTSTKDAEYAAVGLALVRQAALAPEAGPSRAVPTARRAAPRGARPCAP